MLEEILEGINYGGFIYIESIIAADEKGNKMPLPPITVQKVENMPWE